VVEKIMRKGRFNKPAAEIAQRYGESVSFDWRLYRHDIAGSIAHAAALARAAIIPADEHQQIENGLRTIEKEIESGKFQWDHSFEDVHMNIEAALTKRIGAAGAKLHTARSRNDQIALDLRLYVKAEIAEVSSRLQDLQRALLHLAEKHVDVGKIVAHSAENQIPINQVPLAELKKLSSLFDSDMAESFDVGSALAKRRAIGAPSPENIASQIALWNSRLGLTHESA
jgi:argininosuccinate lyase